MLALQNPFYPDRQFLQHLLQALHAQGRTLVDVFKLELWPGDSPATGCRIEVQAKHKGMNVIQDHVTFFVNVRRQGCVYLL